MTCYTDSLKFAWDQTSDSTDSFNWPKGSEGFGWTDIVHLLASCYRSAGSEEMGASLPAFHPMLRKLDRTKCSEGSLFVSYEPDHYCPIVTATTQCLDQPF